MPQFLSDHLIIIDRTTTYPYTSNQTGRSLVVPRTGIDRILHGRNITLQFNQAVAAFDAGQDREFVYLVFKSPPELLLDLDRLHDAAGNFRLKSFKKISIPVQGPGIEQQYYYEATVYLNRRAMAIFLRKLDEFMTRDTASGNPRHQSLIANIEEIRSATLQSFWQEPEEPFPAQGNEIWWEVWLSRELGEPSNGPGAPFYEAFDSGQVQVGVRWLAFPEQYVVLMKATVQHLAMALLYTNRLCELRKPRELAEFFTYMRHTDQAPWIDDLARRITFNPDGVAVCLLDTGVSIANPLLAAAVLPRNLDKLEPGWTLEDTGRQGGHGTPMAGLAIYGDLTELIADIQPVEITHQLESIKLISPLHAHDPENYGSVTQQAVAMAEIINPDVKRIVCMAITREDLVHKGRPSSWSSAVDQLVFGDIEQPNIKTLFFTSAGNIDQYEQLGYPIINEDKSIHDPGQAFNAITVGAYTLKDIYDNGRFPGAELLAPRGGLSPCSSTSFCWDSEWSRKPDIVMEGGNHVIFQDNLASPDSLQILSTAKGGPGSSWLGLFGDTSGATALAARFGALLYRHYPARWPETIRGLIIHSADWTPAMLGNRHISELNANEKKYLIQKVGYGVPNLSRAQYSANNSLSLIAERSIKPYKLVGTATATDEFHLFELPWPTEQLRVMYDMTVRLKVTLSYFIEPNPNMARSYQLAASYQSHGLRFKMIDRNEGVHAFRARVSRTMREEDYMAEGAESWLLGDRIRNKGSIHKDIWEGTAADLAEKNKIAVYPVGGWWRSRKQLQRYEHQVRYSLIVTIETPNNDVGVNIYTPVANMIEIDI